MTSVTKRDLTGLYQVYKLIKRVMVLKGSVTTYP